MLRRWRAEIIGGGALLLCLIALALLLIDRRLEYSFITYRYAQNFAAGRGLTFNLSGPPILSGAVSPLYAILLATGSSLTADLPVLSNIISIVSIGAGGMALAAIFHPYGKLPALLAAGAFIMFPLLWASLGLETNLWLAFGLGGLLAYARHHGRLAAILLALMALIRLEGIILVVVVLADAFASRRPLRLTALGLYAGTVGLGMLILLSNYPPPTWLPTLPSSSVAGRLPDIIGVNILLGLGALLSALLALSWGWIAFAVLVVAGGWEARSQRPAILLAGWALFHMVTLGILQVGVYVWTFAPLAPALAAFTAMGAKLIVERVPVGRARIGGWIAASVIVFWAGGESELGLAWATPTPATDFSALAGRQPDPAMRPVAEWLRTQTSTDVVIGAREAGSLGHLSARGVVDYYGALQPELADALARGDGGWWIMHSQPDYLALSENDVQNIDGYSPIADEWFAANYQEAARFPATGNAPTMIIFQRGSPPRPMQESLINLVGYDAGLTLNGIAADFSLEPLEGGRLGLIRLEWLLPEPLTGQRIVSIRIRSGDGSVLAGLASRTVDFSRWPTRKLITTYHPIRVSEALPSGVYHVQVGVGLDANALNWQTVGRAKIPFEGATDLGGISGAHSEFGDIELIGYRVGRREAGLEALLLWRAIHAPTTDYQIVVQVIDLNGTIVAQQTVQPHGGAYPTSVWSAGEEVTDTILLDISGIPAGEYDVTVGLLAPDNSRALTLDGKDSVFVGRVNIEP